MSSRAPGSMELLGRVRPQLDRLAPQQALEAVTDSGAILVDVRLETHRAAQGAIPGARVLDLTVLPWRLDPTFEYRVVGHQLGAALDPVLPP